MSDQQSLVSLCESLYFPLNLKLRSADTRYQYKHAIRDFGRFLGHEPTVADLNDDQLTIWMSRRLDDGLSTMTVRERAGRIGSLWNWLARRGMVNTWPTFTKPASAETQPQALTVDQLSRLFESAGKERGDICGIPAGLWWTSFLAFVWNTSERKSAALAVRIEWINFDSGVCSIPPNVRKGGRKWGVYHLWPETVPMLRKVVQVMPGRDLVWPFPFCPNSYYTRYDRILKDAGIPISRRTKTHSLRVSHATYLKILGGDPTRRLMHGDPATTNRHYIDARMLPPDQVKLFIPWDDAGRS